jgi:hypothetical protein
MKDRYLKVILTIIAVELLWLGVKDIGTPVSAQAGPQPVVITGIALTDPRGALPVLSAAPLLVDVDRPLPIVGAAPLKVEADKPLPIEAARPLLVQSVPYTPGRTPGE